jgi:hypothetical protein
MNANVEPGINRQVKAALLDTALMLLGARVCGLVRSSCGCGVEGYCGAWGRTPALNVMDDEGVEGRNLCAEEPKRCVKALDSGRGAEASLEIVVARNRAGAEDVECGNQGQEARERCQEEARPVLVLSFAGGLGLVLHGRNIGARWRNCEQRMCVWTLEWSR